MKCDRPEEEIVGDDEPEVEKGRCDQYPPETVYNDSRTVEVREHFPLNTRVIALHLGQLNNYCYIS